jgi:hypothetical protein
MGMEAMAASMGRTTVKNMVKSTKNPRTSQRLRATRAVKRVMILTVVMRARRQILQLLQMTKMKATPNRRTARLLGRRKHLKATKRFVPTIKEQTRNELTMKRG